MRFIGGDVLDDARKIEDWHTHANTCANPGASPVE